MPDGEIYVPVTGGEAKTVKALVQSPISLITAQGEQNTVTKRVFSSNFLYAPVFQGDIIGKIVYYIDGSPVGESSLTAAETVERVMPPEDGALVKLLKNFRK